MGVIPTQSRNRIRALGKSRPLGATNPPGVAIKRQHANQASAAQAGDDCCQRRLGMEVGGSRHNGTCRLPTSSKKQASTACCRFPPGSAGTLPMSVKSACTPPAAPVAPAADAGAAARWRYAPVRRKTFQTVRVERGKGTPSARASGLGAGNTEWCGDRARGADGRVVRRAGPESARRRAGAW